jgi:hypothetical protein
MFRVISRVVQLVLLFVLLASTAIASMPQSQDDDIEDAPVCKMVVKNGSSVSSPHHDGSMTNNEPVVASTSIVRAEASAVAPEPAPQFAFPIRT